MKRCFVSLVIFVLAGLVAHSQESPANRSLIDSPHHSRFSEERLEKSEHFNRHHHPKFPMDQGVISVERSDGHPQRNHYSSDSRDAYAVSSSFDSLNVRFVGNWPFGLPFAVAYDNVRNLAFAGSGGGVYILDVSVPSNPIKISEAIYTRGVVEGFFYESSNQQLYIADGQGGLEIWNVANTESPSKLGYYFTPNYALDVYVSGSYAYVADEFAGLRIINVSDPSSPYEAGYYDTPGYAENVYVSGSYAYVADGYCLKIINVSDPSSPYETGYYDTPGWTLDVYVSGSYAYIADSEAGLRIISVSDPSSPYEAGYYDTPGWTYGVYVSGSYAYVADSEAGLRIINVSDPSSPYEAGYYATPGCALDVYVSGSYAYVADEYAGLRIINVSDPSSPYEAGYYDIPDWALDVYVSGSYAYVVYGYGLRIINVSDPSSPYYEAGYYDIPDWAEDVYVSGAYAYVAGGSAGLSIINVSDPSSPYEAGYYDTPEYAENVYVSGSYAYVADGSAGLQIYQFSGAVGIEDEEMKPPVYSLSQNYPNPFNSATTITYSISSQSLVKIEIYNLIGQKVLTLEDGIKSPGVYTMKFSPRADFTSGLYFYRLEVLDMSNKSKRFSEIKKMVLIK